jgi:glycosyltransferase involved in cell wall biosynthesis
LIVRLLFAKDSLVFPRSSGHDVHAYHMMKACASLGHDVSLATTVEPSTQALDGLRPKALFRLSEPPTCNGAPLDANWLQKRFRSFYGVPDARISALSHAATDARADAVIVVGLDALPYFPALRGVVRVWYAADEWVWHHLSQLRLGDADVRTNLQAAMIKGLYERAHRASVDRAWVVSGTERRAMRWLAGVEHVDVLPNGVDGDHYHPGDEPREPRTAVFWGRLDFGPNIQALEWFVRRVWPLVRRRVPDARFTIIGFNPSEAVRRLTSIDGISLVPDLQDLRSAVRRHALVVLPFVSGGGIKNKLLEAAALGLPIVCTPIAAHGLRAVARAPLAIERTPEQMSRAMIDLWADPDRGRQVGAAARTWVLEHHTWAVTARDAMDAIARSLAERGVQ